MNPILLQMMIPLMAFFRCGWVLTTAKPDVESVRALLSCGQMVRLEFSRYPDQEWTFNRLWHDDGGAAGSP